MEVKRYVRNGEEYPDWYGLAWVDLTTNRGVCYPIPLNILVRVVRLAWLFCKCPFGQRGIRAEVDASRGRH